ncbi:NAD(P)H-dependent oxidoreductase [Listeria rustica]|nr:NAD(P)H-dependent oxidoreductase [Listeria rustica]
MMNVLIIYTYPNHEGLNYAIKKTVEKELGKQNIVKEIDLYKEEFDPVLRFDSMNKRRDLHKDAGTKEYRDHVLWADFLIFIYPIWWSSTPAILKGFIDKVFAKDFAYKYKGIRPIGLLKGKQAWIINTHDTPAVYANFIQKDYGRILSKQILKMCGVSTYKHTSLSYVKGSNEGKINKFLQKVAKISSTI